MAIKNEVFETLDNREQLRREVIYYPTPISSSDVPFGSRKLRTGRPLLEFSLTLISAFIVFALETSFKAGFHHFHLPSVLQSFFDSGSLGSTLLYAFLVIAFFNRHNLYRETHYQSLLDEAIAMLKAVILATLTLTSYLYISHYIGISRFFIVAAAAATLMTLMALRYVRRLAISRNVTNGRGIHNVLIIGSDGIGQALRLQLEQNKEWGYVVKGFIDYASDSDLLSTVSEVFEIARGQFVDEIFVTPPLDKDFIQALALEAPRRRITLKTIPEATYPMGWHAPMEYIGDFPAIVLHREQDDIVGLFLKRALDIVASSMGILLLSPFLVIIALIVKLDSSGPVFYAAERVGRKGRPFYCWKFRSMVAEADSLLDELRHLNERDAVLFKLSNDPRVTRVGRFLRKYSIDEIPQLINVLKGDMSLVGPRPPRPDEYCRYEKEHLRRLDVTPGITGLWQVTSRQDPSFKSYLERDIEYIESWSFWMDLRIILKTFPAVLKGTGQ